MMDHRTLQQALDSLLQPERFKDYGPNGLQVEGARPIRKIVSGVTASRAFIEAAIAANADALFVHHGLFWRGQDGRVTGWMRERLRLLLAHDLHLLAYHLPLDAHPELGNNAQLGRVLGVQWDARFGEQELGFAGATDWADAGALAAHAQQQAGCGQGKEGTRKGSGGLGEVVRSGGVHGAADSRGQGGDSCRDSVSRR